MKTHQLLCLGFLLQGCATPKQHRIEVIESSMAVITKPAPLMTPTILREYAHGPIVSGDHMLSPGKVVRVEQFPQFNRGAYHNSLQGPSTVRTNLNRAQLQEPLQTEHVTTQLKAVSSQLEQVIRFATNSLSQDKLVEERLRNVEKKLEAK